MKMQQMPPKRALPPPRGRTRRTKPRMSGAVIGTATAVAVLTVLQFFPGAGWESESEYTEYMEHIEILKESCTGTSILASRGELADQGGSAVEFEEEMRALKCVEQTFPELLVIRSYCSYIPYLLAALTYINMHD